MYRTISTRDMANYSLSLPSEPRLKGRRILDMSIDLTKTPFTLIITSFDDKTIEEVKSHYSVNSFEFLASINMDRVSPGFPFDPSPSYFSNARDMREEEIKLKGIKLIFEERNKLQ